MQNELTAFLGNDLNLKDLLEIINPQNNLVLADDVMLVDADGVIRMVSENYERDFSFSHNSIVGKTVYELEKNGTFPHQFRCRSFGKSAASPAHRPSTRYTPM